MLDPQIRILLLSNWQPSSPPDLDFIVIVPVIVGVVLVPHVNNGVVQYVTPRPKLQRKGESLRQEAYVVKGIDEVPCYLDVEVIVWHGGPPPCHLPPLAIVVVVVVLIITTLMFAVAPRPDDTAMTPPGVTIVVPHAGLRHARMLQPLDVGIERRILTPPAPVAASCSTSQTLLAVDNGVATDPRPPPCPPPPPPLIAPFSLIFSLAASLVSPACPCFSLY